MGQQNTELTQMGEQNYEPQNADSSIKRANTQWAEAL